MSAGFKRTSVIRLAADSWFGSPYQTSEHLAEDMLFMKELNPHMIGIGPFIPHHDTPFAGESAGTLELTFIYARPDPADDPEGFTSCHNRTWNHPPKGA